MSTRGTYFDSLEVALHYRRRAQTLLYMNDLIHSNQTWKDPITKILNPTTQPCDPRQYPTPSAHQQTALAQSLAQRASQGDR